MGTSQAGQMDAGNFYLVLGELRLGRLGRRDRGGGGVDVAPGCRWSETSSDTMLSVSSGMVDCDQSPVGFLEIFRGERDDRDMKPPEMV